MVVGSEKRDAICALDQRMHGPRLHGRCSVDGVAPCSPAAGCPLGAFLRDFSYCVEDSCPGLHHGTARPTKRSRYY